MWVLAALDHLADIGHARGAKQLPQLGELLGFAIGQGGDHVGTLTSAPSGALSVARPAGRGLRATAAATLHNADGSCGPREVWFRARPNRRGGDS
jgi:hypothetical protein